MPVTSAIAAARAPTSPLGARIGSREMKTILASATTPAHRNELQTLQPSELTTAASVRLARFLGTGASGASGGSGAPTAPTAPPGPAHAVDVKISLRAKKDVWTTTWWPTAGSLSNPDGDPTQHLWAKGGCLDKLDLVLKAMGKTPGALAFEKRPALTWLVSRDSEAGYYIPDAQLREDDAERTTGVDLNGDGQITAGVKYDFLAGVELLGEKDGNTTGVYNADWFGQCDKVAAAGALFEEPKHPVTFHGVTFTPQDVMGLLTLIADGQMGGADFKMRRYDGTPDTVRLRDGTILRGYIQGVSLKDFRSGNFRIDWQGRVVREDFDKPITIQLLDGTSRTVAVEDHVHISRESEEDSPVDFHETIKKWLGDGRPFCMDHDQGTHVWNENYNGADIVESANVPPGVVVNQLNGVNGTYGGGQLTFCKTDILRNDSVSQRYAYWFEKKNGRIVNSGWLSKTPDFLWRPRAAAPSFKGRNERNPFVEPAIVKEIYLQSIGQGPATPTV